MKRVFKSRGKSILMALVVLFFAQTLPGEVVDFITDNGASFESAAHPMLLENGTGGERPIVYERFMQDQFEGWSIDYRARQVYESLTSYEFGMPEYVPDNWAPLSRLVFPIDSTWHGLQIMRKTPNTNLRFEWLTPAGNGINGEMHDYDWMDPGYDFTDLGITRERWNDGQMLDLNLQCKLLDRIVILPVELWLSGGFRWQRLNITAFDAVQVKEGGVWPPDPWTYAGDVITFNQQYYNEYIGGEFRTTLAWAPALPVEFRLGGDYGGVQGYNVDHHLLREGDRYTMESTHGESWHYYLSAEMPLGKTFTFGAQYDVLNFRTQGEHRWYNEPFGTDERWTNGVRVKSDQTWLTLFLRIRV